MPPEDERLREELSENDGLDENEGENENEEESGDEADFDPSEIPDGVTEEEWRAYLAEEDRETRTEPRSATTASDEAEAPTVNVPLLDVSDQSLFNAAEWEELQEIAVVEPLRAQMIIAERTQRQSLRQMQRMMQANSVASAAVERAEREFPEVFAVHGGTIRNILASADPSVAGSPETIFASLIAGYLLEVRANADPIATFKRMGRAISRGLKQEEEKRSVTPPIPRTAPTSGRSGDSTPPSRDRRETEIKEIMRLTKLTRPEAEEAYKGMRESRADTPTRYR